MWIVYLLELNHFYFLVLCLCNRKSTKDEVDGATPAKKIKSEKVDSKEEAEMKKQNKVMFEYRDQLKSQLQKKDLQELLEYNDQDIPPGHEKVR